MKKNAGKLKGLFLMGTTLALIPSCGTDKFGFVQNQSIYGPGNPAPVCNPLNGDAAAGVTGVNGIKAELTYYKVSDNATIVFPERGSLNTRLFAPGSSVTLTTAPPPRPIALLQESPNPVYFDQLNKVTSNFTTGFTDVTGAKLTDADGSVLEEFFSFRMQGRIGPAAPTEAGYYQFAVLADDGAIFRLDKSKDGVLARNDSCDDLNQYNALSPAQKAACETIIWDDGAHRNRLGCSAAAYPFATGDKIKYILDYYQGQKTRLGLILLWRKVPPANLSDPECGVERDDDYYFTQVATSTVPVYSPTANFTNLLARGWQVVPPPNFYLDDGQTNPCN